MIVALGAAIAGFVQGLTGFAFGLTALAFWAWVLDPRIAGPLVVLGSLLGNIFSLHRARSGFELARIAPLLIGGLIGVPLGVVLLGHLNANAFKLGVGILLVVYCPVVMLSHRVAVVARLGKTSDVIAGVASGVMSGLGGLGGSVSTLWCTLRGWDRDALRATFQSFNFAVQIVTVIAYLATGVISKELLRSFALVGPILIVPAFIGGQLYGHFSDVMFRRLILGLLTISGFVLILNVAILR
ncbi:MAG TPA: sulfite exporter TauE/SafE family protein [Candidatus Acidoferrales bacterium]|nr:sulfite exporter TauE/SafE family protein [Candidatus Acidoferrales bacterium]